MFRFVSFSFIQINESFRLFFLTERLASTQKHGLIQLCYSRSWETNQLMRLSPNNKYRPADRPFLFSSEKYSKWRDPKRLLFCCWRWSAPLMQILFCFSLLICYHRLKSLSIPRLPARWARCPSTECTQCKRWPTQAAKPLSVIETGNRMMATTRLSSTESPTWMAAMFRPWSIRKLRSVRAFSRNWWTALSGQTYRSFAGTTIARSFASTAPSSVIC